MPRDGEGNTALVQQHESRVHPLPLSPTQTQVALQAWSSWAWPEASGISFAALASAVRTALGKSSCCQLSASKMEITVPISMGRLHLHKWEWMTLWWNKEHLILLLQRHCITFKSSRCSAGCLLLHLVEDGLAWTSGEEKSQRNRWL